MRGDHRGRCWGDILGNCSYSRTDSGGRDGGGVPWLGGQLTIIRIGFVLYYHQLAVEYQCFCLVLVHSLSSLVGEMEGKDREREEN